MQEPPEHPNVKCKKNTEEPEKTNIKTCTEVLSSSIQMYATEEHKKNDIQTYAEIARSSTKINASMASISKWELLEQEVPFQAERRIAKEIMDTVNKLELPFKLDQLTQGDGNCFPRAIIQQCKRPEIFSQLRPPIKRLVKDKVGYSLLRSSVHNFIIKSKLPNVA